MERSHWKDFRLYAITDFNHLRERPLLEVMEQILVGGAQMLQLRNKTGTYDEVLDQAAALRKLTRQYNVPLIINDYPDIAIEVDADGVHLGQDDMTIQEARALLGSDRIIGISTHNIQQALEAEREGANYIGVGPVFATNTKPGRAAVTTSYVEEAAKHISIPFVTIGGITLDNIDSVLHAGAKRICAVSAIVGAEHPAQVCRDFLNKIGAADDGVQDQQQTKIKIIVNGQEMETAAVSVEELIEELGQQSKSMLVEHNETLLQRQAWTDCKLQSGTRIELIQFVGGG